MGLFRRHRDIASVPADPASTLGARDVLPGNPGLASRTISGGNAMLGRATRFYKDNPKLVGGAALVASALLLNRLRTRRTP